jgi:hypothetical protein
MPSTIGTAVTAVWRRAIQGLAYAFDTAWEADSEDTVFQPREARSRGQSRVAPSETADAVPQSDFKPRETMQ